MNENTPAQRKGRSPSTEELMHSLWGAAHALEKRVRSNITQLMDRLEAEGLVQRLEDPADRRAVRAALTSLGVQRQAAGAQEVEKVQKEFAKMLSGIDQVALKRALEAIK